MVAQPTHITMRQKKLTGQKMLLSSSFRFVILGFICVFGVLYVMQTSTLSAKSYEMNDLKQKAQLLEQDGKELDCQIAEQKSIKNIEEKIRLMDLVGVNDAEYVSLPSNVVAVR